MPLLDRLRWKRSYRRYNVISKDVIVIGVQLLDGSTVECTLTANNSAQECVHNVCQRCGISQPEFFGLQYRLKRDPSQLRWADLQYPSLKRQLERYAESNCVHFAVMFCVHETGVMQDERSRSLFFIQLKQCVLDGHVICNHEQAIRLVSYCLQAELGDFHGDKYSVCYLNKCIISMLPKNMLTSHTDMSQVKCERLCQQVFQLYTSLRGLTHSLAQLYYIMEVQQLDSYGVENFSLHSMKGEPLSVGASVYGIVIKSLGTLPCHDSFGAKLSGAFPYGTYKWRDISNLHNHRRYFAIKLIDGSLLQLNADNKEDAKYLWKYCVQLHGFYKSHLISNGANASSLTAATVTASTEAGALSRSSGVTTEARDIPDIQRSSMPSLSGSRDQLNQHNNHPNEVLLRKRVTLNDNSLMTYIPSNSYNNITSQDNTDFRHTSTVTSQISPPTYRQAPDYETAVRRKYGVGSALDLVCPQMETHEQYKNYTDLSCLGGGTTANDGYWKRTALESNVSVSENSDMLTNAFTYSTPELNCLSSMEQINQSRPMSHQDQLSSDYCRMLKLSTSSTSTPDLASSQTASVCPDVISIKQNHCRHHYSDFPSSKYSHLLSNELLNQQQIYHININPSQDLPHVTGALSSNHVQDRRSANYPQHTANHHQHQQLTLCEMSEPIYENVTNCMRRSRTCDTLAPPTPMSSTNQRIVCGVNTLRRIKASVLQRCKQVATGASSTSARAFLYGRSKSSEFVDSDSFGVLGRKAEINSQNRCQQLKERLNSNNFINEFEAIQTCRPVHSVIQPSPSSQFMLSNHQLSSQQSTFPHVNSRYRHEEIIPYEDNKVCVTHCRQEDSTRHLNASHINITVGDGQRFYIMGQLPPTQLAVREFWIAVWQNQVRVLVAFTPSSQQLSSTITTSSPTIATNGLNGTAASNVSANTQDTQPSLSNNSDKRVPPYAEYLPPADGVTIEYGDLCVRREMSTQADAVCTTRLCVWQTSRHHRAASHSRDTRHVWHVHTTFPDLTTEGVSDTTISANMDSFLQLLHEVDALRQPHLAESYGTSGKDCLTSPAAPVRDSSQPHLAATLPLYLADTHSTAQHVHNTPLLVHCRDGAGASGVFVMCHVLLAALSSNLHMDVAELLYQLRMQRMCVVSACVQYRFVYQLLVHYLESSRLI